MPRFQLREIVHRKSYRPEVQGHVAHVPEDADAPILVCWDINHRRHSAYYSTLPPNALVSDGFFQEPEHLKAVEANLDPEVRETAIRSILNSPEELLRWLAGGPERPESPRFELNKLRRAHLAYLEARKVIAK